MKTFATRLLVVAFVTMAAMQATAQITTGTIALNTNISSKIPTYTPKANDVLTYQVTTPTSSYTFTVIIKTLKPDLSFDWVMSGDVNQKGSVFYENATAADAMGLHNMFTAGAVKLKDQTSVWVSNTFFKLLKSNVTANVSVDKAITADGFKNCGIQSFTFDLNGTKTTMPYVKANNAENCAGDKTIYVLDNAQNPLIMYMNMGWTIELKSIKQQ